MYGHFFGHIGDNYAVSLWYPPDSGVHQYFQQGTRIACRDEDHGSSGAVPASAAQEGTRAIPDRMTAVGDAEQPHQTGKP